MNHQAIYNTHSAVKSIWDTESGVIAYDADGNEVTLDVAAVEAETVTVEREQNFKILRAKRNQLLAETDYFANTDVTMSDEMRSYRQALRDLPATTDPANPTWPVRPD